MIKRFERGSRERLSKNFQAFEFDCSCGDCPSTLIDLDHVSRLQILRNFAGPIRITSAYRCMSHNKRVGGAPHSQHVLGTATDIQPYKISLDQLKKYVSIIEFSGVGFYSRFVHVDNRLGRKAKWSGK